MEYLADSSSTAVVNLAFYVVNWTHGLAGIPSPAQSNFLIMVRKQIVRSLSQGRSGEKKPLDIHHLKSLGAKNK